MSWILPNHLYGLDRPKFVNKATESERTFSNEHSTSQWSSSSNILDVNLAIRQTKYWKSMSLNKASVYKIKFILTFIITKIHWIEFLVLSQHYWSTRNVEISVILHGWIYDKLPSSRLSEFWWKAKVQWWVVNEENSIV